MRMRIGWAVVLVAVAYAVVCLAQEQKAEEPKDYVVNGSFEEQLKDKPKGWQWYFWPKAEGIDKHYQLSKEQAKTGDWSLKITLEEPYEQDVVKGKKRPRHIYVNGRVLPDVAKLQGKTLALSASVYVPDGSQGQTVVLRLRQWARKGKNRFKGDLVRLRLTGKPGEWVTAEKTGVLDPAKGVEYMDMQCSMVSSKKAFLQYVDDIKLVVKE